MNTSLSHLLPKKTTLAGIIVACSFLFLLVSPVHAVSSPVAQMELIQQLMEMIIALKAQLETLQAQPTEDSYTGGAPYSCVELSQSLWFGANDATTNGQVSKLQKFLTNTGDFTYGKITGLYGPATVSAVQKWQKRNGIISYGTPDTTGYGTVGEATIKAMRKGCEQESVEDSSKTGIDVALQDVEVEKLDYSVTVTFEFEVTALGGDVSIPKNTGYVNPLVYDATGQRLDDEDAGLISTALVSNADSDNERYHIDDGSTETFQYIVALSPRESGKYRVGVEYITIYSDVVNPVKKINVLENDKQENRFISEDFTYVVSSDAEESSQLQIVSGPDKHGVLKVKLNLPKKYDGYYVHFMQNPADVNLAVSSGSFYGTTYHHDPTKPLIVNLDVTQAHEGFANNPGGLHWFDLPSGKYTLGAVVYPKSPFKPGTDMEFMDVGTEPPAVLILNSKPYTFVNDSYTHNLEIPSVDSFTATPSTITPGMASTLYVGQTNATECIISRINPTSSTVVGSFKRMDVESNIPKLKVSPKQSTVYKVLCTSEGGSDSKMVTVEVMQNPSGSSTPTMTLTVSPTTISAGDSVKLSWSSTNANYCSMGDKSDTAGTIILNGIEATKTYTMTCTGLGGSVSKSVTVTVNAKTVTAPTLKLSASPLIITKGGSTKFTWSAQNASYCSMGDKMNTSGSQTITGIDANKTYTVTCYGDGGSVSESFTITVASNTLPPYKNRYDCSDGVWDGKCLGMWDYGNDFGNDKNMCFVGGGLYGTPTTGCVISVPQCPSGSAKATEYLDIRSAPSVAIEEIANSLSVTTDVVRKGLLYVWQYDCVEESSVPQTQSCVINDIYVEQVPGYTYYNLYIKTNGGMNDKIENGTLLGITGSESWDNLKFANDTASGLPASTYIANQTLSGTGANYVLSRKNNISLLDPSGNIICSAIGAVSKAKQLSPLTSGVQTTNAQCTSLSRDMHRGAESSAVLSLQKFLVSKGLLHEEPTAFYGDLTVGAVKAYQKSIGLPETGMVYEFTRNAIQKETCTQ